MAELPDDDLTLPKTDAGLLFRLEMWATNVLLGYWWVGVAAVVIILAAVGIYGIYDNQTTQTQRELATRTESAIRKIDRALIDRRAVREYYEQTGTRLLWAPGYDDMEIRYPITMQVPLEIMMIEFGLEDVDPEPILIEVADELMVIARDGGASAGGAQAALHAAELYRLAEQHEPRRAALDKARQARQSVHRFSAELALAQLELSAGNLDAAEAILRPWIKPQHGFFGQHAALQLARAYRRADRKGDAIATLQELQQIWPASVFADDIDDEYQAMGEVNAAAAVDGDEEPALELELAPDDTSPAPNELDEPEE
ncbi:MAG: hypothetical protein EA397_05185 [Deltaproteobacteria bacterium]|nr:MAG: hypothetical protein EA397_05185 [Deltaproteobacteria bacterium]